MRTICDVIDAHAIDSNCPSSTRCGMEIIDYGGDLKNEITEVGDREQRDDFWG
jgi:hypothetical protein